MCRVKLFFVILFILTVSCAEDVSITENDHTIFPLKKAENKNKVIYAVKTNGKCAITGVFPYWQMDQEDGHTEKLLSYEEGVYGVGGARKVSDETWTFYVAKMPKREIRASVISETSTDGSKVACKFIGVTQISGIESVLAEVMVNNHGNSVDSIDFYGTTVTDQAPIHENFVP